MLVDRSSGMGVCWVCTYHLQEVYLDCPACIEASYRNNKEALNLQERVDEVVKECRDSIAEERYGTKEAAPARKDDATKPDMSLITYSMMEPAAKILKFGETKYGRYNYRNPNPGFEQRLIAATLRHLLQHTDGQELDSESGEPHLAHALASLMLIFDRRAHKKEGEVL
jgi:hypothetical protein